MTLLDERFFHHLTVMQLLSLCTIVPNVHVLAGLSEASFTSDIGVATRRTTWCHIVLTSLAGASTT